MYVLPRSLGVRLQRAFRHPIAAVSAAIMLLATPALVFAHARLVRSAPAANAVLDSAPNSIGLWFSERPEPRFTSVQLLDSAGASIPLGAPTSVEQNGVTLAISGPLARGAYSIVWRTAASDGHPTNGRFSFRLAGAGAQSATPPPTAGVTVAPIVPSGPSAPAVVPTSPSTRWVELTAVLLLIGATVFRLAISTQAGLTDDLVREMGARTRRIALGALVLYAVTTVARIALQTQLLSNPGSPFAAIVTVARETRWGHGWLTGAVGAVVALIGLLSAPRSIRGWFLAALGAVLICVGESLTGHAAAMRHTALAIAADVTHVLGAGAWMGTLAIMVTVALPVLSQLSPADAPKAGSSLARSYHTAAVDGVALVVLSGVIAAFLRLPAFNALWTTDYGSWLFRKLVFVLFALVFGAYHWRRVVIREWSDDTRRRFSRTALGELVVGLVIVAFTSMLVSTPLPLPQ